LESRVLQYAKARPVLAIIAGVLFAGSAAAQGANPFAFLFGGAPQEGRSAYSPSPPYARPEIIPGYSSLPGFSDPSIYEPRRLRHSHPRAIYHEQSRPHRRAHLRPLEHKDHGQSAKEVMAAIEAVKSGKGPLGPFLNDPTLRAGDIVMTTHGLMVFRGAGSPFSHGKRICEHCECIPLDRGKEKDADFASNGKPAHPAEATQTENVSIACACF